MYYPSSKYQCLFDTLFQQTKSLPVTKTCHSTVEFHRCNISLRRHDSAVLLSPVFTCQRWDQLGLNTGLPPATRTCYSSELNPSHLLRERTQGKVTHQVRWLIESAPLNQHYFSDFNIERIVSSLPVGHQVSFQSRCWTVWDCETESSTAVALSWML
jgi:hypothetical protein